VNEYKEPTVPATEAKGPSTKEPGAPSKPPRSAGPKPAKEEKPAPKENKMLATICRVWWGGDIMTKKFGAGQPIKYMDVAIEHANIYEDRLKRQKQKPNRRRFIAKIEYI
jgi:hypothetical protein